MNFNQDNPKDRVNKTKFRGDEEIKERFRVLLRESLEMAAQNGHTMRIEEIKLEKTHMWGSAVCKSCGGGLYLDYDKRWQKDKTYGSAVIMSCSKDGA
jgi:hypothetical protein